VTTPRVSFASVIARDFEALATYYAGVFGLPERLSLRSHLFRGLIAGDLTLGYHHEEAAQMLQLPGPGPQAGRQFVTFEVGSADEVEAFAERAVAHGGRLAHAPYRTYYGADQAVLLDPEGNPFRVNHLELDDEP
jgi:catechol 2,3-dioxygenase-like lactoylglutathione lyase family enzyme